MRLWENVRTLTLSSTAPTLVYEEGSLIKRSIRDLYNKDISEIIVSGEEGYREAKDFMKMLMPSHAKVVQPYRDLHPIFARSGIEAQLDRMLQPQVTLKSGGYLIMNQTEALVAIDVNSGRSTREHSIEETALQTNLEAAEEVARQLRLRDLAGLIVIDFIDMEEKRNNRAVEKKLKDCLKNDRARIQVGRISHFGLLEMSRQRIRASVLESTTQICTHCGGTGHVRSQSSVALHVLRGVEEYLLKNTTHDITVRTTPEIALYLLNHKRSSIVDYENRFGVSIFIESDVSIGSSHFAIDRGEPVENPVKIESLMQFAAIPVEEDDDDIVIEADEEEEEEAAASSQPAAANADRARQEGDDQNGRKRKRRRRRRNRGGERGGDAQAAQGGNDDMADGDEDGDEGEDDVSEAGEASEATVAADADSDENNRRKRRRRGKRGGRRNRNGEDGQELSASDDDEAADGDASDEVDGDAAVVPAEAAASETPEEVTAEAVAAPTEAEAAPVGKADAKPRRSRRGKAATAADAAAADEVPAAVAAPAPVETVVEQVEAALGEEPQAAEVAPAAEAPASEAVGPADAGEAKPARANRASNISSSAEAVVKSSDPAAAPEAEGDPSKPKKAGWWQRRGFF